MPLCKLFGVSKQAYYKCDGSTSARKAAQESFALEFIHTIRSMDPGIGGMKLWHMYKDAFPGIDRVGRDKFEDIIDRHGLKVRRKMRRPRTTDSTHGLPLFPNLVRELIPTAVNQLWVTDITYIPVWIDDTHYMFCYLSLVTDAYSHEIIGWAVGPNLGSAYPLQALEMAKGRLGDPGGALCGSLIHHSDRGVQYASREYVEALRGCGIRISMTENGDPKENAIAERINSTMKNELLKGMRFRSVEEVREAVGKAVHFYNNMRPHMSVDMMTPAQAARCHGEIVKWWKSYREEAIKNGRA